MLPYADALRVFSINKSYCLCQSEKHIHRLASEIHQQFTFIRVTLWQMHYLYMLILFFFKCTLYCHVHFLYMLIFICIFFQIDFLLSMGASLVGW